MIKTDITDILLHTLTCTANIAKKMKKMQIRSMERKDNHGRLDQAGINEKDQILSTEWKECSALLYEETKTGHSKN